MVQQFGIYNIDDCRSDYLDASSPISDSTTYGLELSHYPSNVIESLEPNLLMPLIDGSDDSIPGDIMGEITDESDLASIDDPVRELPLTYSNTIGDSLASTMGFSRVILGADSISPQVQPSFAMTSLYMTVAYDLLTGSKFWVDWLRKTLCFDPGPAMLSENATNRLMHLAQYMFDEMPSRVHVTKLVRPFVFAGNEDFGSAKHISSNSEMQITFTIGRFATFLIAISSDFGVDWFGRSFDFYPGPIIIHVSSTYANSLIPCYTRSTLDSMDASNINTNSQMYLDSYRSFKCYCCVLQLLHFKGFSKSRFSDIPGIWLVGSSISRHYQFLHKFWGRFSTGIWKLQLYLNENGFKLHLSVATALVAMYVKYGNIEEAFQLEGVVRFVPNFITLVSMFDHGLGEYIVLIRSIFMGFTTTAHYTTNPVINDYKNVGVVPNVPKATELFGYTVKALITAKDHSIVEGGFSCIHLALDALLLMDYYGQSLVTMMEGRGTSFLQGQQLIFMFKDICTYLTKFNLGHQTDNQFLQMELAISMFVWSAIIIMSMTCTLISSDRKVFDQLDDRTMDSGSTILSVYSLHGFLETSFILFFDMHLVDIGPYQFTNLVLLHAIAGFSSLGDGYVWHKWKTKLAEIFIGPHGYYYKFS